MPGRVRLRAASGVGEPAHGRIFVRRLRRAGWTTASPDGRPIVGPIPSIEGLFVATALADDAFRLAPSIAEGLSQQLSAHPLSAYDPALFSPDRFDSQAG